MLRQHVVLLITIRPPWCFLRRAGYEPAPGFTFSLPFIIISHSTTQLHCTNTSKYSYPNLNFLQYTIQIQILVPHVMCSAQAVHESKIDHTQCHLSTLRGTPKHVVQWAGIRTHTLLS